MARRRRSRARENPSAGFWIAVGVGVVAVGGVAYVMTRPSTAAAATTPPPTHPLNDAGTFQPSAPVLTPAQNAAITASLNNSISSGTIPGGVALAYSVNGRPVTQQYVPSQANLANDVQQALTAANAGHGPGKEGEAWVARAKVDGAGPNELAQLRAAGYAA